MIWQIENENKEISDQLNSINEEIRKAKREHKKLLGWWTDFNKGNVYKQQEKLRFQQNELKKINYANNVLQSMRSAALENNIEELLDKYENEFPQDEKSHHVINGLYLMADPILGFFRNTTPIIFLATMAWYFYNKISYKEKPIIMMIIEHWDWILAFLLSVLSFIIVFSLNLINFIFGMDRKIKIKTITLNRISIFLIFCFSLTLTVYGLHFIWDISRSNMQK